MRHFTVDAIMDGIDFRDEDTIKEIANRYRNKFHDLQPLYAAVAVHGPAIASHVADEVMSRVNQSMPSFCVIWLNCTKVTQRLIAPLSLSAIKPIKACSSFCILYEQL